MSVLKPPKGEGGTTTAISATPAACAGTTVISKLEGYAAAPPGMHTPTRRIGRYKRPSSMPSPGGSITS